MRTTAVLLILFVGMAAAIEEFSPPPPDAFPPPPIDNATVPSPPPPAELIQEIPTDSPPPPVDVPIVLPLEEPVGVESPPPPAEDPIVTINGDVDSPPPPFEEPIVDSPPPPLFSPPPPAPIELCPQVDGSSIRLGRYPSSPFKITPFQDVFKNPPRLAPKLPKVCRDDEHCMASFVVDMYEIQKRPFDKAVPGCAAKNATWFMSYNGQVPGPTVVVPSGSESVVRFRNRIQGKFYTATGIAPCNERGRTGRPTSIHFHGSASLAPWDGWAEDITCRGESKDYVYPNNRAVTGWYHDHALHITAKNAYAGLAGMYIVSSKKKDGAPCGAPWNMEELEELHWILQDKVLDSECQLFFDSTPAPHPDVELPEVLGPNGEVLPEPLEDLSTASPHEYNFYGDINMISGIPFPRVQIEPKWYRIRMLNAAVSRPWLIKIFNAKKVSMGHRLCKVIATDGGYRHAPVNFPIEGLLIGVAERYEVVCDFSRQAGRTFHVNNVKDEAMIPNVPFFCNSHLVARIEVGTTVAVMAPGGFKKSAFNPLSKAVRPLHSAENLMTTADFEKAKTMANAGQADRKFVFSFVDTHPYWRINNDTWDTAKVAASDVGQNTWELWEFESVEYQDSSAGESKWFHPIHVHLVDFFVVRREGGRGLQAYEERSPKDVILLPPLSKVWIVARFGAHKGDYMFHCHNLVHEDDLMMRAFSVVDANAGAKADTVQEQFMIANNVIYNNWRYTDPMLYDTSATRFLPKMTTRYMKWLLNRNFYRIFYPLPDDTMLNGALAAKNLTNPWKSKWGSTASC